MSFIQVGSDGNFKTYGADISSFAGQITEIRFTAHTLGWPSVSPYTGFFLDDIRFSDVSIPEPSASSLIALGSLVFVLTGARTKSAAFFKWACLKVSPAKNEEDPQSQKL